MRQRGILRVVRFQGRRFYVCRRIGRRGNVGLVVGGGIRQRRVQGLCRRLLEAVGGDVDVVVSRKRMKRMC